MSVNAPDLFFIIHELDGYADGDTPPTPPAGGDGGTPPPTPPEVDLSKLSIDELAKLNPAIAELAQKTADAEKARLEVERKKAEDEGRHKDVITEQDKKIADLERKLSEHTEITAKYADTVSRVVEDTIKTLPEEKKALIPSDYSPRQKLEYISANAKWLGVTTLPSGDGRVPPSDTPPGDDKSKLTSEIDELHAKIKKGVATALERELMFEKSKKLKELQAKK